jgi:hypothetical protein
MLLFDSFKSPRPFTKKSAANQLQAVKQSNAAGNKTVLMMAKGSGTLIHTHSNVQCQQSQVFGRHNCTAAAGFRYACQHQNMSSADSTIHTIISRCEQAYMQDGAVCMLLHCSADVVS